MASPTVAILCITCNKRVSVATCDGCQQRYCTPHFNEHRQLLTQQMEHVVQDRNTLKEDLDGNCKAHPLISDVDRWEQQSIKTIRNVANQARVEIETWLQKTKDTLNKSVSDMAEELKRRREEEDYTEKDLERWKEQLKKLRNDFEKPSNIGLVNDEKNTPLCMIKIKQKGMFSSETSDKVF